MTRQNACIAATLVAMALAAPLAAAPGYTTTTLDVPHRTEDLQVHVWYPAQPGGAVTRLGRNLVFQGVDVRMDAQPITAAAPVVLLSHGSGGNAVNLGWIAADLADRGMIVVATNHPGTTSGDSVQSRTIRIWERPRDLSAMLDALPQLLPAGANADANRIAAMGFSLGGHSVLGLAGARVSKAEFVRYCADNTGLLDCGWYADGGVDLTTIDQPQYEQSNLDPRVRAVVSVDPALAQAYVGPSLALVDVPVLVVNLRDGDGQIPAGIDGRAVAAAMPYARSEVVENAVHFSFLGGCRSLGRTVIWLLGEDPICSDAGPRTRADIHRELSEIIGAFLTAALIQG